MRITYYYDFTTTLSFFLFEATYPLFQINLPSSNKLGWLKSCILQNPQIQIFRRHTAGTEQVSTATYIQACIKSYQERFLLVSINPL
jgi:hypothetical protein